MSVYLYRANNNNCRDNKLRFFRCNECGSIDLKNPRDSESDHRDVLRFTCNQCGNQPYESWMGIYDIIPLTEENLDEIFNAACVDWEKDPSTHKFDDRIITAMGNNSKGESK